MVTVLTAVGLAILIANFIYCLYKSFKKGTHLGRLLSGTFASVCVVFLAFAANYLFKSELIMEIMCAVEHAAMDFALYFLNLYTINLIGIREIKSLRNITLGAVCLDAIILITNPINHLAFNATLRQSAFSNVIVASGSVLFYAHLALCGILILLVCYFLTRKIFSASKYYHLKYACILIMVVAFVVSNIVFNLTTELAFDYSKLLYAVSVIFFYYLTYAFEPRTLLRRLQEYVADNESDPTILYDLDGGLLNINKSAFAIFAQIEFRKIENVLENLGIEDEGIFRREIGDTIYEVRYEKFYDRKNIHIASAFFMHDVTENERQVEREHRAAILDPLTGCFNRIGFFEHAKKFLEHPAEDTTYSILICGICSFKGMNGLYGTKTGDQILCTIAERLHNFHHLHPMIYGRSADGKFSCLVPNDYVEDVIGLLNEITVNLGGDSLLFVDLCYGYVKLNQNNVKFEDYYEMALMALSNCKKTPKASREYTQDMADEVLKQQLLLAEIHDEVDGHQFYIELQPQIDLKKNKVCGAEALVRWEHPTLGKIPPNVFIPLFEANGYVTRLDHFVWEQAASTLAKLSDAGLYEGHISVNVSQVDIMNTDVAADMEKIIRKYGVAAEKLHVEITESACAENRATLIATMNRLREKGFPVEIDDFGSGYSSLNALMKLPFDIVKLDMVFMREYVDGEKSDVVISSIAKMIHDLNATIVVEGIENTTNLRVANGIEADVAQGYFFSKPVSIQKFVEFVSGNQ